jgi:hypothetical protein
MKQRPNLRLFVVSDRRDKFVSYRSQLEFVERVKAHNLPITHLIGTATDKGSHDLFNHGQRLAVDCANETRDQVPVASPLISLPPPTSSANEPKKVKTLTIRLDNSGADPTAMANVPAAVGTYVVQVSAQKTEDEARASYQWLQQKIPKRAQRPRSDHSSRRTLPERYVVSRPRRCLRDLRTGDHVLQHSQGRGRPVHRAEELSRISCSRASRAADCSAGCGGARPRPCSTVRLV